MFHHLWPSGVLSCWPNSVELAPRFYLGSNEQHRLFYVYLKRTCSRVTSASSALGDSQRLCAIQMHALTHSLSRWLLWHWDFAKFDFGWGSAPVSTGGAYDAILYVRWYFLLAEKSRLIFHDTWPIFFGRQYIGWLLLIVCHAHYV